MIIIDGDGFKALAKRVYSMLDASPSLKYSDSTRRILELHGYGLRLLTIDCAKLSTANGRLKVDWLAEKDLPDDHVTEWDESLYNIASGLR